MPRPPRRPPPPALLPYQQAWVRDRAQVKVWEKSRRIGASWCDAADSVLEAASESGQDVLYIGYSQDMTREYIDDCAMWARAYQRAAAQIEETVYHDEGEDIKAFRLDFVSGRKVLALSSRPRSIRGKQGKVVIDEAAFHDDLPGLLKAALAMLIWGGRVAILSTHNGEDNPFNLLVRDIRAGKLRYALHRTTFCDALDAGLFERVKLILGHRLGYELADGSWHEITTREEWRDWIYERYGEAAAEELDCIPRMGSGAYFPRTLVERCQRADIPVLRFSRPAAWVLDDRRIEEAEAWCTEALDPVIEHMDTERRTCLGLDIGRSGDLSYLVAAQDAGSGRWREAFALEMRRVPFDVQRLVLFRVCDRVSHFWHAKIDARGLGQQLAEEALQRYGPARIECVMASPSWYAAHFPRYKAALEDRSYELAAGEDVIADHRRVVLKHGYPTMDEGRDRGSDGEWRHGDGAIARVLLWAATRSEAAPIEFTALERPRAATQLHDYLGLIYA